MHRKRHGGGLTDPIAERVNEDARAAKSALDRGCAEDLARVERFLAGPLSDAQTRMRDQIASLGDVGSDLRKSLLVESAGAIAQECWRRVFDNVALRFRVRFLLYAGDLEKAEERFHSQTRSPIATRRKPRRTIVPRIEAPEVPTLVLDYEPTESIATGFTAQLERYLREAIALEVRREREVLVRRGTRNLARARIALDLNPP
ncbi:MAG TPA: hypothetical protein VMF61_15465 [Candidatus Acidoferrales bacterium]|nr:hypothetical protein [Candidatus Acidoferrales bacterium]